MARIPEIEARLQRWAQALTCGDGNGYPAMSVIHIDWMPPSPGTTPTMKTASVSDVRSTHAAVQRLSPKMRATIVAVYLLHMSASDAGLVLECQADTVLDRIERAHRVLRDLIEDGSFATSGV